MNPDPSSLPKKIKDASKDINQENALPGKDLSANQSEHSALGGSIGAVSGGVVGAVVGNAIGGKGAGVMGAVVGAVAGGLLGDAAADDLIELEQRAAEVLGEAPGEDELPAHYSWEQLQALSKPQ